MHKLKFGGLKLIILKNVNKTYFIKKHDYIVLDNIDLNFKLGEFVAILGESGSGKSTLLNILGGLDTKFNGEYIVGGRNTKEFTAEEWDEFRKMRIGFIFQSFNLIPHLTVLENVEIALTVKGLEKKERLIRAKEMLKKVGLEDHLNKLPDFLSGGEQQRVAIARALVKDPDIILADEPTGELDTETAKDILNLIMDLTKDKLVIMVTHAEESIQSYASKIIKIEDGKIIEEKQIKKDINSIISSDENKITYKIKNKDLFKLSFKNLFSNKILLSLLLLVMILGMSAVMLIMGISTAINKQTNDLINQNYDVNKFTLSSNTSNQLYKDYDDKLKSIDNVENIYLHTILYPAFDYQENINDVFIKGRGITGNLELLSISINQNSSFRKQIVIGSFPNNKNEILISRITAINLIYNYYERNNISTNNILNMSNIELYNIIRSIDLSYFTSHKEISADRYQVGNKYYQKLPISLTITGLINDDKFYTPLEENNKIEGQTYYYPRIYITQDLYYDVVNQYNDKPVGTVVSDYQKVSSFIVDIESDKYETRQKVIKEILDINGSFNYFQDPIDELYNNFNSLSLFLMGVGIIFGIIMFSLSSFIVGTMIYRNLEKRKKEFGTLFSLGLSKENLKYTLFFEGFISGAIGIILSIAIFYICRFFIKDNLNDFLFNLYEIDRFPSYNPITLNWYLICIVFILILFAFTFPIRKFKNLSIIEALREE